MNKVRYLWAPLILSIAIVLCACATTENTAVTTIAAEPSAKLAEVKLLFSKQSQMNRDPERLNSQDWINRNLIYGFETKDNSYAALIDYLTKQYHSNDPVLSLHALFASATLKQTWTFEPLISTMQHHKNGFVRGYAARALGLLGDKRAIPYLEKAVKDPFIDDTHGDLYMAFVTEGARAALNDLYGYKEY